MYGLKQTPHAWYERLTQYLLKQSYTRGNDDKTLFVKTLKDLNVIAKIYVDDIVFGSTSLKETQHLVQIMKHEFEMSLVGELTFFLGLQVTQTPDGIFLSQSKFARNLIEKFGLMTAKDA